MDILTLITESQLETGNYCRRKAPFLGAQIMTIPQQTALLFELDVLRSYGVWIPETRFVADGPNLFIEQQAITRSSEGPTDLRGLLQRGTTEEVVAMTKAITETFLALLNYWADKHLTRDLVSLLSSRSTLNFTYGTIAGAESESPKLWLTILDDGLSNMDSPVQEFFTTCLRWMELLATSTAKCDIQKIQSTILTHLQSMIYSPDDLRTLRRVFHRLKSAQEPKCRCLACRQGEGLEPIAHQES